MNVRTSVNELEPEMLGIHSLNFAARHDSSNRAYMFSSHFSQRLVTEECDEKRIQTGVEREFGKYTFNIKMPANGKIMKVIDRYPTGIAQGSLPFNPETLVIYENDETKEVDCFFIPYFASYHQFFGFKYVLNQANISKLRVGADLPKGMIFADSPGVDENHGYKYGNNLNVAFMSIPSVSEDGMMISKSACEKLKFRIFERRTVEFGASHFPLNLYGNKDSYQPFPSIGDYIREDGILMMMRSYENGLAAVEMSIYDTMEPDFVFDKAVYVRGGPDKEKLSGKGRVVDVKVFCNNNPVKMLPGAMTGHINKYQQALFKYHSEIVQFEEQLRNERKRKYGENKPNLSPKFHRLVVESMAIVNRPTRRLVDAKSNHNLNLLYRKTPIDEYRIEFVIEYVMTPTIGYKLSDSHGGKGVIVKIEDDDKMPIDEEGNRADIVTDAASVISRMNIGRLYEHYINSAIRDVHKRICSILGVKAPIAPSRLENIDTDIFHHAYQYLLHFYEQICDKQFLFFRDQVSLEEKYEHMRDVVNRGIYIYYPINNDKPTVDIIKSIEKNFKPRFGPVTYTGNSGQVVKSQNNIRIAPLYMMLLDKIADDWSSVSTGKLQHFGVLSPMTKSEKFLYPFRNSPVRTIGETEGRIFAGYCGREAIAEMMDRSNSPLTQRNITYTILSSDKPGNIEQVVDRNYVPLGGTKTNQLVQHMFQCAGFKATFEPENIS